MKTKTKEVYEAPSTTVSLVELEGGLLTASVFDAENEQDDGVSIEGHEVGNSGDYTELGWDNETW